MTPQPQLRQRMFQAFFLGSFAVVAWQMHRIISPFYPALLAAGLLCLVVYPLHDRILRRLKGNPSAAALLTTAFVVLVVVLPLLGVGWVAARQASKLAPVVSERLREAGGLRHLAAFERLPPRAQELWKRADGLLRRQGVDPAESMLAGVEEIGRTLTGAAKAALKNLVFFLFQVGVTVFSLFFLLRDGPKVFRRALDLVPMPEEHKSALVLRLQTTVLAVLRGIFIVAGVQGLLAAIGFLIFRVPFSALLGLVTAFVAPIPFVGPPAVWVPVAIGLALVGAWGQAVGVVAWCVVIVGLSDNILRPILIGSEARLPILLLFFGMLGGLSVYGVSGIIIGPVVVTLFLALADIYRRDFRWLLAPDKETP